MPAHQRTLRGFVSLSAILLLWGGAVIAGNAPLISVSPSYLTFTYLVGDSLPPAQFVSVTSSSPVTFTASPGTGCNWLSINPASGTTPASFYILPDPLGLSPGNYACIITVTGTGTANGVQSVAVVLTVTQQTTISVSPSSLAFTYGLGGNAPATQTAAVTSTNPAAGVNVSVATSTNCAWLALKATKGVTPFQLTAGINTSGLTAGSYTCALTVTAPGAINGPQTIEVSLAVANRPPLVTYPTSLTFNYVSGAQQPKPQSVFVFATGAVAFSASSAGSWLSLSFSNATTPATFGVAVNPAGLAPGSYPGSITIHSAAANPATVTLPVTLNVASLEAPPLTAAPPPIAFSFVQGANEPQTRQVTLSGSGSYSTVSDEDCTWMNITPSEGTLEAGTPAVLSLTADPTGLGPQTYTDTVVITSPEGPLLQAFVTMTVSCEAQHLMLSHTGLAFRTALAGTPPSQNLYISGSASRALPWSVVPTTLSGGNWLNVSPATGVMNGSPSPVQVRVNTVGLAPGEYHGQLLVSADAANSPRMVGVVLTIGSGVAVPPAVDPAGLIFTTSSLATQTVSITNRGAGALSFQTSSYFAGGTPWFTAVPATGTIDAGRTQQIAVAPNFGGLTASGVYSGELNLGFGDNSAQRVHLMLIASGQGSGAFGNCAPTSLSPLITSVGGESTVSVGRPMSVQVKVVDNCGGTPPNDGSMQLDFNNHDASIGLMALSGGLWTGTVTPRTAIPGTFDITVRGRIGTQVLSPYTLPIPFGAASAQPAVAANGVSSAASYAPQAPMAPGSIVNIYGSQLADQSARFSSYPLPTLLGGTQVLLGTKPVPLLSVSAGQIVAQVPYELGANMMQQLVVRRGVSQSAPETLPVAPAQPAIFTVNQQGTGQAIATVGNSQILADATHPVKAGDVIVIYCAGLGAVNPLVPSGSAAPTNPPGQTITPAVTIGGQPARVLFSGLTPGFAGLYQINAVVPAGVTAGSAVPVVVTVAAQTSPAATIAVTE